MSFAVRRNGGGGARRGGFVGPVRRVVSRPVPARPVVATSRPVTVTPARPDFTSHYDPSRVIDLDNLKVVQDLRAPREYASERGETPTGDEGITGPGSTNGAFSSPTRVPVKTEPTGAEKNAGLIFAALAAALILGG